MEIPAEADWRDHMLDLDVQWAFKNFGGKDLKAAYKMFAENSLSQFEDLTFMPVVLFSLLHSGCSFLPFVCRKQGGLCWRRSLLQHFEFSN